MLANKAIIGSTHLSLFLGIILIQIATGVGCSITNFQNKIARKIGRDEMKSFSGHILKMLLGKEPLFTIIRGAGFVASMVVLAYYKILVF